MYVGNVEITPREAIFSVTIASVLFLIGFLVATRIEHGVNQRNLQYRQAAKISEPDEFSTAMQTDVGNAFVEGQFSAVDTVTHGKLGGEWLFIEAVYRKYTRHTRVVHYTTTDGKGHTRHHTRTEVYWTWDRYDSETLHSKKVNYIGTEFAYGKFSYSGVSRVYREVPNGFHRRIDFEMIRPRFRAAAYTKLERDTLSDKTVLYDRETIESLYGDFTHSIAVAVFWWVWAIFSALVIYAFVALENWWLEDRSAGVDAYRQHQRRWR